MPFLLLDKLQVLLQWRVPEVLALWHAHAWQAMSLQLLKVQLVMLLLNQQLSVLEQQQMAAELEPCSVQHPGQGAPWLECLLDWAQRVPAEALPAKCFVALQSQCPFAVFLLRQGLSRWAGALAAGPGAAEELHAHVGLWNSQEPLRALRWRGLLPRLQAYALDCLLLCVGSPLGAGLAQVDRKLGGSVPPALLAPPLSI